MSGGFHINIFSVCVWKRLEVVLSYSSVPPHYCQQHTLTHPPLWRLGSTSSSSWDLNSNAINDRWGVLNRRGSDCWGFQSQSSPPTIKTRGERVRCECSSEEEKKESFQLDVKTFCPLLLPPPREDRRFWCSCRKKVEAKTQKNFWRREVQFSFLKVPTLRKKYVNYCSFFFFWQRMERTLRCSPILRCQAPKRKKSRRKYINI